MKPIIAIIYLLAAIASNADSLRISALASKSDAESERMTLKVVDGEEVLFVKKKVILTQANIVKVWLDPKRKGNLWVELNDAGFDNLVATTVNMFDRKDRLAVIVDNRLISILTVHGPPLGRFFVIAGLHDFELHKGGNIIRIMSGLPTHAVARPPLPDVVR